MAKNYLNISFGLIFVVTFLMGSSLGRRKDVEDGYRLFRLEVDSHKTFRQIFEITRMYKLWKMYAKKIELLVYEKKVKEFEDKIKTLGIKYEILSHIPLEKLKFIKGMKRSNNNKMSWDDYQPLNVIYNWLDDLEKKHPEVKTVIGGKTYEGRDIKGIEVTFGKNLTGVFLEAGTHAREWISPAGTSWMMNKIIKSPKNSTFRQFNYIYFPIFNPDGYVYSWTTDRLWRKTRTPYKVGNKTCYGADPNRNWDFHWNTVGTSDDPCSEIYPGPFPFSEVETKTLSEFIKKNKKAKNIDVYISFHSYSQTLVYPWGDKRDFAPQKLFWEKISKEAAKAYKSVHNKTLKYGQGSVLLYPTSGPSDEWFYGTYNASIVFTMEMRDSGDHGFLLSKDQIIPSGEEILAALKSILKGYIEFKKPILNT